MRSVWLLIRRPPDSLISLLHTWTCPDVNNPVTCNPCGIHSGADDSWGYLYGGGGWEHIGEACSRLAPLLTRLQLAELST